MNPATSLPLEKGGEDTGIWSKFLPSMEDHDCMAQETVGFSHVKDSPLHNPDFILFVDGSRYFEDGNFHTGYAVVDTQVVHKAEALPSHMSAQEAELKALAEACRLEKDKTANIYTDSRYAFGIAHDYGRIWKARAFLTSAGTPIKNSDLVKVLMEALMEPTQVAIIKIKAHTKVNSMETKGNDLADRAEKTSAPPCCHNDCTTPGDVRDFVNHKMLQVLQKQSSPEEQRIWQEKGAIQRGDGLWTLKDRLCLPRTLHPMMAEVTHGKSHQSKTAISDLVNRHWFAPGFSLMASKYTQGCMICAHNNVGRTVKVPQKQTLRPLYPFQRLQINYIQLPKVGVYEYVLVCMDLFSGWPEAFPVAKANAISTAKKIMAEVVCRYGVPEVLSVTEVLTLQER
ncbi:uncharacterized protein LOC142660592 [Rhinoderma darwinii]|uniref:uncharacterized protein LOC142660592 n=1 Tax=Rhinoderma darwinii TaxID=43563 RepID=UPI003F66C7AF